MNSETKTCQSCKKAFAVEPTDLASYEQAGIPASQECHLCVWKRLLSFWVFGRFRKTTSALSGARIITTFSESVKFPLYTRDEWASDNWDPTSYGRAYDFTRPFFEQLAELQARVPHPHQSGTNNVNCDWNDDIWSCRECYLCRSLLDCEYVGYGYRTFGCKYSYDLVFSFDTELSYDCVYCFKCYKVRHAFDARSCIDSAFLYDCRNCQNCFLCWNLRNKSYHIRNQPHTKEEYFEKLKSYDLRSYAAAQKLKSEFAALVAKEAIHRADHNTKTVESSGNFLEECRRCHECYFVQKSEDTRYMFRGLENKNTIFGAGAISEKSAYTVMDGYLYGGLCTSHTAHCRYATYLDYCEECEYCFGCVGLRKKRFCILNKQYAEADYHATVSKIKDAMQRDGSWGKFFPPQMAYGGYNFSTAQFYFPETKKEIEKRGWLWEDEDEPAFEGIPGDALPDRVSELTDDDFSTKAIICPATKRRFNVAAHELEFLRKHGIPLPHHHPDYRMVERFRPLTVVAPHQGTCAFCGRSNTHYYPPEWGYRYIACIECYHARVS